MATKVEDLNLYQVRVRDKCYAGQIEATSDQQARAFAAGRYNTTVKESDCEITRKEPVFEKTIGLDCSEGESESDVFEIRIRGVSAEKVDKLAQAIYTFIGGPGMSDREYDSIHSPRPLVEATEGVAAFI